MPAPGVGEAAAGTERGALDGLDLPWERLPVVALCDWMSLGRAERFEDWAAAGPSVHPACRGEMKGVLPFLGKCLSKAEAELNLEAAGARLRGSV